MVLGIKVNLPLWLSTMPWSQIGRLEVKLYTFLILALRDGDEWYASYSGSGKDYE